MTGAYTDKLEETGGVYIETSENQGWTLDDRSRRFEGVESLDSVRKRSGIDLTVTYQERRVQVKIADPNSVRGMALARNDEVGSTLRHATLEYGYGEKTGHIEDLVAQPGEHITITPFAEGIRVRVYPRPHR